MIGRRVAGIDELERGGDYARFTDANGNDVVYFLLPGARDEDAKGERRALYHVAQPPHTFRECADGSLEIRASIACYGSRTNPNEEPPMVWHGFLDEGHVWRQA